MTISILPRHVAIIMDGNGRWAKRRFLPRAAGHRAGAETTKQVIQICARKNIQVLSLFAFSSENWQRPESEVNHLMTLFLTGLEREVDMLNGHNIQLRFIGDRTRFSEKMREKISEVERETLNNTGMRLLMATDYGGQWDLCEAIKKIAKDIEKGQVSSEQITPHLVASKLSFSDLPDPDLFIRTSGEQRISNFMLWQLSYTELYFTDTLWPDFSENELNKALAHYANRERRFGDVVAKME